MRRLRALPAVLVAVVLVTGCAGSNAGDPGDAAPAPRRTTSSAPGPIPTPAPSAPAQTAGASDVCAEVVAGINAFNTGDFDETVDHFEKAVPLAEAADDGSPEAGDLLDAVRYYAELAPDDYLEASATSAEFARWKAVTLGQCADAGLEPGDPGDSGDDGVDT